MTIAAEDNHTNEPTALIPLLGIRVPAQVLTTKIQDENKGTKIDTRQ